MSFANTLRHQIRILTRDHSKQWKVSCECRAKVEDLFTNHYHLFSNISFGSAISKSYKIITVRYNKNITSEKRIDFQGKYYLILKIVNQSEANKVYKILVSRI